jgi:hypothetical protein
VGKEVASGPPGAGRSLPADLTTTAGAADVISFLALGESRSVIPGINEKQQIRRET